MEAILVPLGFFAVVFCILYIFFSTRNKERLAMIEKGVDPSMFAARNSKGRTLRLGMLAIGVAAGIILAVLIDEYTVLDNEAMYPAMIILFGGIALVLNHFLEKKGQSGEDSE